MIIVKALKCKIYRNGHLPHHGFSNRYDDVYVICPDGDYEFDLDDKENLPENLVKFQVRNIGGKCDGIQHKEFVLYNKPDDKYLAFGGSFAFLMEDEFTKNFGEYPIPIYDNYI